MELFRNCLDDCGLVDLGFSGPKFTWTNRQDAQCNVRVRLDRAVANGDFTAMFEFYHVDNIITTTSDHYAVAISLDSQLLMGDRPPVQHNFRYEAMWRRAEGYIGVVENAWKAHATGTRSLHETWSVLNHVSGALKEWSKEAFGSV
ncbi:hypothetical protein ACQJBY_057591 [Aegilops geniculata]